MRTQQSAATPAAVNQSARVNLEDHAGYATEKAKLRELIDRRLHQERLVQGVETEIVCRCAESEKARITAAAECLISGADVPGEGEPREGIREELKREKETLEILKRAVKLQEARVGKERSAASRDICLARRNRWLEVNQALAHAIIEVASAAEAEKAFRDVLIDADVEFSSALPPLPFNAGLAASSVYSKGALWLRAAVDAGAISSKDIPAEWQARWAKEAVVI